MQSIKKDKVHQNIKGGQFWDCKLFIFFSTFFIFYILYNELNDFSKWSEKQNKLFKKFCHACKRNSCYTGNYHTIMQCAERLSKSFQQISYKL